MQSANVKIWQNKVGNEFFRWPIIETQQRALTCSSFVKFFSTALISVCRKRAKSMSLTIRQPYVQWHSCSHNRSRSVRLHSGCNDRQRFLKPKSTISQIYLKTIKLPVNVTGCTSIYAVKAVATYSERADIITLWSFESNTPSIYQI